LLAAAERQGPLADDDSRTTLADDDSSTPLAAARLQPSAGRTVAQ